jgi:thiol-disulfide isomerase/thioredoxin
MSLIWMAMATAVAAGPEMIPEADADLVGRTAPAFEAPLLRGGEFDLEDARGKPVVLSFWASWCGPCRLELPALDALQQARPDIAIYAVNVDRERGAAERFLRSVPISLPVVWDNTALALGQYDVTSMPTMFLLDANGTIKLRKTGFSKENGLKELEAALEAL